ncbi:ATP11 protein-domain-containing protein, partial [Blyttiomyces helicus]
TLDQIADLDLLKRETPENVKLIWNEFHASKQCLSGVMEAKFYSELMARTKKFPMFILPLPRAGGYEFFLLQTAGHQTYLTPLLEYKTHRQNARPHLVLTHYTELAESKGLVLMVGELGDPTRKVLTLAEAQNLVYQMQLFYVTGSEEVRALVDTFHADPAAFDYQRVIDAIEKLGV